MRHGEIMALYISFSILIGSMYISLLKIQNQVTYKNENITLLVKSLTNKFTRITFNGNTQTYMKELFHINYNNKILSD